MSILYSCVLSQFISHLCIFVTFRRPTYVEGVFEGRTVGQFASGFGLEPVLRFSALSFWVHYGAVKNAFERHAQSSRKLTVCIFWKVLESSLFRRFAGILSQVSGHWGRGRTQTVAPVLLGSDKCSMWAVPGCMQTETMLT